MDGVAQTREQAVGVAFCLAREKPFYKTCAQPKTKMFRYAFAVSCSGPCNRIDIGIDEAPRAMQASIRANKTCTMCGHGATYLEGRSTAQERLNSAGRKRSSDSLTTTEPSLAKRLKTRGVHKRLPNVYALVTGRLKKDTFQRRSINKLVLLDPEYGAAYENDELLLLQNSNNTDADNEPLDDTADTAHAPVLSSSEGEASSDDDDRDDQDAQKACAIESANHSISSTCCFCRKKPSNGHSACTDCVKLIRAE